MFYLFTNKDQEQHPGVILSGSVVQIIGENKNYFWIEDNFGHRQWAWKYEVTNWRSSGNARNIGEAGGTVV